MSLPAYLLRFLGGSTMLLGAVGVLEGVTLGPFYFLLGLSMLAGGLPRD